MAEHARPAVNPLAQALGRIPSGLYILTVRSGEKATGLLASWVQQAGFEPPMITIAVQRDRFVGDWIAESGRFTLNQIAIGGKGLIRHFSRGFSPDEPAFEGLEVLPDRAQGGPVLEAAMAYLDAELAGEIVSGDHRIILARVVGGDVLSAEAEPLKHVRSNGFHY
ncbi:MAG: flavin reductase family protein [Isosphaeraceae bacterium]|nr:flavin reductase family protein [Isosphaeraceae bacterium]